MRLRSQAAHFLLASLPLLALLFVLFSLFHGEAEVAAFFKERRALHPQEKQLLRIVTDLGNLVFYGVYGAILYKGWRAGRRDLVRLALVYAAAQLLISFLLVRTLKIVIGRPRPGYGLLLDPLSLEPTRHSLPSGHTTEIVGAFLPLALIRRSGALSLAGGAFIALVAFSRVYLGEHHPSDLFLGWTLGSFSGALIYAYGYYGSVTRHERTA